MAKGEAVLMEEDLILQCSPHRSTEGMGQEEAQFSVEMPLGSRASHASSTACTPGFKQTR